MISRIEQIIDDIEDYIASCKGTMFSGNKNKIVIERERMEELLTELRQRTPDEIKKYQKMLSNQEAIIAEARSQADHMLADAKAQTDELINEHEIMQRAYEQANMIIEDANKQAQEIVDNAVEETNVMRDGAVSYTDEMLNSVLVVMKHAMEGADSKFVSYMQAMQSSYDIVESNLSELRGTSETMEKSKSTQDANTVKADKVSSPVSNEEALDYEAEEEFMNPKKKGKTSQDDFDDEEY